MTRNVFLVLYVVMLIAVVVSVDLLFFRNRFWERLMVNVGIVLVFAAFYLRWRAIVAVGNLRLAHSSDSLPQFERLSCCFVREPSVTSRRSLGNLPSGSRHDRIFDGGIR